MKKQIIFIFISIQFSLFTINLFSQPCLPEGIIFNTQAQIDSFQINYPGCTQIEGNVLISGGNITNLSGLIVVSEFGEDLRIFANGSLINLSGLDNVINIGGDLYISGNYNLIQLAGLENLSTIQGSLKMGFAIGPAGNPSLIDFTGLDNLTTIGGDLKLIDHDSLTSFMGLENLVSIGGSLEVGGPYGYLGNPSLESFNGLNNLSSINGDISIRHNPSLTSLYGLHNLNPNSINNLYVNNNDTLSSCEVQSICDYLVSPNGIVEIYDNGSGCNSSEEVIEACEEMQCLPDGIIFSSQAQIDNFQVNHPNCAEIEGNVLIVGNDITNLYGLSEITSIGGGVTITGNYALTNLTGFENLTTIEGSLTIGSHAYPVWIDNPLLNSLTGLEHLTYIGGNLEILCAPILGNLTGLDSLITIGGNFSLGGNVSLSSLSGLDNLTTINGSLIIGLLAYEYWLPNPALSSLMGLENLGYIGGDIQIGGNESLSICNADGICEYFINPSGDIDIWDNAPGCNSQQEVESVCYNSVNEINSEEQFSLAPNPSSGFVNLQLVITEQGLVNCELLSISGVKTKTILNEVKSPGTYKIEIDLNDISAGVYFCVLKTNPTYAGQTKKIIKL